MRERGQTEAPRPPAERTKPSLGSGRPLDAGVRQRMEAGFGRPLGHVRVHDGPAAAGAARMLGAQAFAVGGDLVFGAGRYRPGTPAGDALLAHELAHSLQPERGGSRFLSHPGDAAEREASRAAAAVAAGERPVLAAAREALVHRTNGDEPPAEDARWTPPDVPPPSGETIRARGLVFSENRAANRALLERYYAENGQEQTRGLVEAVERYARSERASAPSREANVRHREELDRYGAGDVSGTPLPEETITELETRFDALDRVASAVRAEWNALRRDLDAFLPRFQTTGEEIVRVLLAESEREVRAERARYGITEETRFEETVRGGREGFRSVTTYGMARNAETEGLTAAAADLARRLRRLDELHRQQTATYGIRSRKVGPDEWDFTPYIRDPARHEALGAQIRQAQQEYDEARASAERTYPVLGAWTEGRGDAATLADIGGGAGSGAARILAQETGERLADIARVRANLGDRFSIWKQAPIVDLTKRQLGVLPGSPQARAVDENVQRIRDEEFWRNLAFAVIGIALALVAAIPTGGASIGVAVAVGTAEVAGLALTIYSLQDTIRRYQLESAAAGTAFQRARAISQEEPTLFWVALELVAAGLQIRGAAQTFSRLAQLHRAASSAAPAVAGAVDRSLDDLLAEARRVSPTLADRLAADVAARRAARGALREATGEAAEAAGRTGRGALPALRRFMAELIESVRSWGRRVFARLGFRSYEVSVEGDHLSLYGIRSRILLARIRISSIEDWVVTNTPEIAGLRHSRASQLGRAASAVARGDEALANLLRGNAVRLSEELGEIAADAVVRTRYGLGAPIFHGHGSGVFDLVYELGGQIFIVEAKGGAGRLGTRLIRPGLRAEQGTVTYVRSVIEAMSGPSRTAAERAIAARIRAALDGGNLRYVLTETPIPAGTAPLETTLSEFVVRAGG